MNEDLLFEILQKKEDFEKLKNYISQTEMEKSLNHILEQYNLQLNEIAGQIFEYRKKIAINKLL